MSHLCLVILIIKKKNPNLLNTSANFPVQMEFPLWWIKRLEENVTESAGGSFQLFLLH